MGSKDQPMKRNLSISWKEGQIIKKALEDLGVAQNVPDCQEICGKIDILIQEMDEECREITRKKYQKIEDVDRDIFCHSCGEDAEISIKSLKREHQSNIESYGEDEAGGYEDTMNAIILCDKCAEVE